MRVKTVYFLLVYVLTMEGGGAHTDEKNCDLFKGKWVWDKSGSYPMYNALECPFITPGLNCQKNGRPDNMYLNFRWQPHGCSLARSVFVSPFLIDCNQMSKLILFVYIISRYINQCVLELRILRMSYKSFRFLSCSS